MNRFWIIALIGLLLTGCVIGTKGDAAFAMRAFFEAGFSCGRIDPSRTLADCWRKYSDIVER